jgi:hypothetical protein
MVAGLGAVGQCKEPLHPPYDLVLLIERGEHK